MSDPWGSGVRFEVDQFVIWMSRFSNQSDFVSLQGAYESWLHHEGFEMIGNNYAMAVQIILVYLSCSIANPPYRRYLSNPPDEPDEYTIIQIKVPEEGEARTFWEFLIPKRFHQMYRIWKQSQLADQ